jgi:hypothetical protein
MLSSIITIRKEEYTKELLPEDAALGEVTEENLGREEVCALRSERWKVTNTLFEL